MPQTCWGFDTTDAPFSEVTYHYNKLGAGFASLTDRNGKDWITWKPRSAGGPGENNVYRGIPNLGPCCHPGYGVDNDRPMTTTFEQRAADRVLVKPPFRSCSRPGPTGSSTKAHRVARSKVVIR